MRFIAVTTALLLVASAAPTAIAEPPPQAAVASAPAITVADAQALPAVLVTQPDSVAQPASSSTAVQRIDTTAVEPVKDGGHGLGFWAIIGVIAVLAIGGYLAYRYVTKEPESVPVATSEFDRPPTDRPADRYRGKGKDRAD